MCRHVEVPLQHLLHSTSQASITKNFCCTCFPFTPSMARMVAQHNSRKPRKQTGEVQVSCQSICRPQGVDTCAKYHLHLLHYSTRSKIKNRSKTSICLSTCRS